MITTPLLLFGGMGAVVGGAIFLSRRAAARRRAALEGVALQAGWSFKGADSRPGELGVGDFPLFTRGSSRRARNVSRGTSPPLSVFDYSYAIPRGNHRKTVTQTVVHVESSRRPLPPFTLSPESAMHRFLETFGYHDIDFDASPEFSRRYLLRSKDDEASVRTLFDVSVRAYFEQRAPVNVEAGPTGLIVYRAGRRVPPDEMRAFVDDALEVARQFVR
jgi:carbonic anhydrase